MNIIKILFKIYFLKFLEAIPKITNAIAKIIAPSIISIIFVISNIARIKQIPTKIIEAVLPFIYVQILQHRLIKQT